jgi:hypothetical protein
MLRNVVKCCENRFHNFSQHFTTFHNIARNLTAFLLGRLQNHQHPCSNWRTYGLSRKSLYRFSNEVPRNVVKSRLDKNSAFWGILIGDFTTFSRFHNISQYSDYFHNTSLHLWKRRRPQLSYVSGLASKVLIAPEHRPELSVSLISVSKLCVFKLTQTDWEFVVSKFIENFDRYICDTDGSGRCSGAIKTLESSPDT